MQLSFLKHELMYAAEFIPGMLKGLERICYFYYDSGRRQIISMSTQGDGASLPLPLNDASLAHVARWRKEKKAPVWLQSDELPFDSEYGKERKIQFSFEDEDKRNILLIPLRNVQDHLNDLIFIYLDKNMNHFGMQRTRGALSQDQKLIIQELISNTLNSIIEEHKKNQSIYAGILANRQSISTKYEQSQKELEKRDVFYKKHIKEFVRSILEQSGKRLGMQVVMEESVYDEIFAYRGDLDRLEKAIRTAAEVALNTHFSHSDILKISQTDFILPAEEVSFNYEQMTEKKSIQFDRYAATIELLDRYEDAAKEVLHTGEKLIGKAIGARCNPPITNAAITDSIKKHGLRILELFDRYPERWGIIRSEFKSIQNLSEGQTKLHNQSGKRAG